jgi:hypothetical protein
MSRGQHPGYIKMTLTMEALVDRFIVNKPLAELEKRAGTGKRLMGVMARLHRDTIVSINPEDWRSILIVLKEEGIE